MLQCVLHIFLYRLILLSSNIYQLILLLCLFFIFQVRMADLHVLSSSLQDTTLHQILYKFQDYPIQTLQQVIFKSSSTRTSYLHQDFLNMKIQHFYHSLSCIYYLLQHDDVLIDIFRHVFHFLSLIRCHSLLIVLILPQSFLNMEVMPSRVKIENMDDQADIFHGTYL